MKFAAVTAWRPWPAYPGGQWPGLPGPGDSDSGARAALRISSDSLAAAGGLRPLQGRTLAVTLLSVTE